MDIPFIDSSFIENNTDFPSLIRELKQAFLNDDTLVPMRHHHDFPNPKIGPDSTMLLMPAWNPNSTAGVKIVTVSPENSQFNLPSIQGTYIYFDSKTGSLKALLEAKKLTAKRTAAASALASSFLSNTNASSLLVIGTGTLSVNLILAHASVRPIKKVYVWGRSPKKADDVCQKIKNPTLEVSSVNKIEDIISDVDIISCATLSKFPLVFGRYLRPGQHLDLVGAYKKDMREADDDVLLKSSIFVDTYEGALKETGDLVIPLKKGVINKDDIQADLFELCQGKKQGRKKSDEITLFKSVGHALEDLAAANYYFNHFTNE